MDTIQNTIIGGIVGSILTVAAAIGSGSMDKTKGPIYVAHEPSVAYNVEAFCKDPTTKVTLGIPMEVRGTHYLVTRGLEQVDWKASDAPYANTAAVRTWPKVDANGVQLKDARGLPAQDMEQVEITMPAGECIRSKLGK